MSNRPREFKLEEIAEKEQAHQSDEGINAKRDTWTEASSAGRGRFKLARLWVRPRLTEAGCIGRHLGLRARSAVSD